MSKNAEQKMLPFDPSQGRKDRKVPLIQVARMLSKRLNPAKLTTTIVYKNVLKLEWVHVSKLALNYSRQRFPEPKHIKKLLDKWNIICVTPLQARYDRKKDIYYIADGQQHGIAWVLMYGEDAYVPVLYVESEDENIESIQLLALNTDSEPMAKYFIHNQRCVMGDPQAIALEKCVNDAGCETSYKKRSAGTITHITDLWLAEKDYGLAELGAVLAKMRQYWPSERIYTATMLGLLKTRELLKESDTYSDDVFEDLLSAAADYFESSERLHLDIKDEFEKTYPTNYKGMGVREKIASGLIDIYEKSFDKTLCDKPFDISMPWMQ